VTPDRAKCFGSSNASSGYPDAFCVQHIPKRGHPEGSITHTPCGTQLASLAVRAHLISSQCLQLQFGSMAESGVYRWRNMEGDYGK